MHRRIAAPNRPGSELHARRFLLALAMLVLLLLGPWGMAQSEDGSQSGDGAAEEAAETPVEDAPPLDDATIVYGLIDDEITLAESAFVNRLLDEARLADADVLLLELNTFGGRVDAAVAIRDLLIDADQETVVFINKRAISAGALISYACDKIVMTDGGTIGAAAPIVQQPGQEMPAAVQEKYLSYFREEMRSTAESKGRDPDVAEAMVDEDKEIEGLVEKGKLLTLTTRRALELGLADLEADSVDEILDQLGYAGPVQKVERSWSEQLVAFLTSEAVAGLLFLGMMLFGYMEFQTPGFGVFGGIALFCFLLLYFSHYMVNLAGYEELILFVLGVVLLVVEMLVIPGIGIAAVLGAICILSSMVLLISAGDWSDVHFENPITRDAINRVSLVVAISLVMMVLLIRYLPKRAFGGGIVLDGTLTKDAGYASHEPDEPELVGAEGTALSDLRPSGRARLDGRRLHVETEGDWIEEGEQVRVVRQVEGRIVVRRIERDASGESLESAEKTEEEIA